MLTFRCYDKHNKCLGCVFALSICMAELIGAGRYDTFSFALEA
jgi:hypothetical protein